MTEAQLRRFADRLGFTLRKSRVRYVSHDNRGGYRLVDPFINTIVAGEHFDLSLHNVEEWLRLRAG